MPAAGLEEGRDMKERTEEQKKELAERFKNMGVARKLIIATKQSQGTVECPVCKKKLGFSVSKFNGHVWAACETSNCLQWME